MNRQELINFWEDKEREQQLLLEVAKQELEFIQQELFKAIYDFGVGDSVQYRELVAPFSRKMRVTRIEQIKFEPAGYGWRLTGQRILKNGSLGCRIEITICRHYQFTKIEEPT